VDICDSIAAVSGANSACCLCGAALMKIVGAASDDARGISNAAGLSI
jgi:hypothetical protein